MSGRPVTKAKTSGEAILAHLFAPLDSSFFFANHWGREFLHVARDSMSYYDDVLRPEDIDLLLQSEHLAAAYVNVISSGAPHALDDWSRVEKAARGEVRVVIRERLLSLYRAGATLVFNQIYRSIPRLSGVCGDLASLLGFPVRANAYVTPSASQGFERHSDDHEILILQIAGSKDFILYPHNQPSAEIRVRPGDLLYIPRGLAHEARAGFGTSVHVSMGLYPVYAFELVEELAAAVRRSPEFQQLVSVPCEGPDAARTFEDSFRVAMRELVAETPVASLVERRTRARMEGQPVRASGRFIDMLRVSSITVDSVVIVREGAGATIEEQGLELKIRVGSARITVAAFLRDALEQILDGAPHPVGAIRGMLPDEGKLGLVRSLIEAGLLSIVKV